MLRACVFLRDVSASGGVVRYRSRVDGHLTWPVSPRHTLRSQAGFTPVAPAPNTEAISIECCFRRNLDFGENTFVWGGALDLCDIVSSMPAVIMVNQCKLIESDT